MMTQKKQANILVKILLCVMLVCTLFGGLLFVDNKVESTKASAAAPEGAIEYEDLLGLEDRTSWGAHAGECYFGGVTLEPFGYFNTAASVSTTWHADTTAPITANGDVDIMKYIYVNGECARDLIAANYKGSQNKNSCGCWLSNPAAWPVYVETTTGDGLIIRLAKAYFGDTITLTFKAGFSLIRSDNQRIYVSSDITYTYANGVLGGRTVDKSYNLSFEGTDVCKTLENGEKIGELPAIPENDGRSGVWTIDGVEITADTAYTFGANKTAVVVYEKASKDVTDILGLEDRTSWASGGHADIVTLGLMNGFAYFKSFVPVDVPANCWYQGNTSIIEQNNGVDILQYIYINETNARDLLIANQAEQKKTDGTGTWLSNPAAWPVAIETTGDVWLRFDKKAFGDSFKITIKKGFSIIDEAGDICVTTEDIIYTYANGALSEKLIDKLFTLSFEGTEELKTLKNGEKIGALPAVPAIEGKVGVWQIDGAEINAETVYNYGANKTAAIVYYEGTDIIDTLDMANWGTAAGADCTYIRVGNWADEGGNLMMSTAFDNVHWQDHASSASVNYACDIMEYIYINGKSARAISTENGLTGTYGGAEGATFPFNMSGVYAPIDVYTSGNEFYILVMTDYVAAADLEITFKAGFRMATSDGGMLYLSKDFVFPYYTVTFDGVATKKVNPNTTVVAPADPTKEETESHTYAFDAWYNGDEKWNFDTPVTANLTLTAKFIETEKAKYSVTFNADNGAENTSVSVYVNSYVKEDQIPANPEKTADGALAYTFLYWSLDGENAYDFATPVTQDIILTAVYTTKPLYTVTLGETTVKVVEGGKVEQPADPTKESTAEFEYVFEGWYLGETKWDFENNTVTSDVELVAKYTEVKRSYTVSFNVMGNEEITFESVTLEYGTTYDLSTLLDGKDVSAYTYTITVNGEAATSVEVLSDVTVDVTFTAKAYYKVTIDGVEQMVEEGAKVVKPATEPTKESSAEFDYIFDAWYNGETKWDFENDTVTSDLELVAKYTETKRKYTITFTVTGNDSITLEPVEVEYGTTYDLSNLFEGKDVSGYSYSITIDGVEKISFKVIADTTITIAFTAQAENNEESSSGCGGIVGTSAILSVIALGVVVCMKKKED